MMELPLFTAFRVPFSLMVATELSALDQVKAASVPSTVSWKDSPFFMEMSNLPVS